MVNILPDLAVEVIIAIAGAIVSVGIPLILTKINKFNEVYTTVFGVENVQSMSGLVGVVENHDEEIQEIKNMTDTLEERHEDIRQRVQILEQSVQMRRGGDGDG